MKGPDNGPDKGPDNELAPLLALLAESAVAGFVAMPKVGVENVDPENAVADVEDGNAAAAVVVVVVVPKALLPLRPKVLLLSAEGVAASAALAAPKPKPPPGAAVAVVAPTPGALLPN